MAKVSEKVKEEIIANDAATDIEISKEPILYDARQGQVITLEISQPIKATLAPHIYKTKHHLKPLTNTAFFNFAESSASAIGRSTEIKTDWLIMPSYELWTSLIEKREGYKEPENFEKMSPVDCVSIVRQLLHVQIVAPATTDALDAEILYDEDELIPVRFISIQGDEKLGNVGIECAHFFKPSNKKLIDEYLSIEQGTSNPNELMNGLKLSDAEKFYKLGKKIVAESESIGYAEGSPIPAFHLVQTTRSYFLGELSRMGKSWPA